MQIVSTADICMKCQILFSGENKKNITNLSSAELALRVVKIKTLDFNIRLNFCDIPKITVFIITILSKKMWR